VSDSICSAKDVKAAGEEDPSNALESRKHGGNLPFVDAEVGRDGTIEALAGKDLSGFVLGSFDDFD